MRTPAFSSDFANVSQSVLMVMFLVMAGVLVMSLPMAVTLVFALALIMAAAVTVTRHVFFVVPIIAHKVDRSTAGVVLRTMLAPVFLVTRRHVQVDRRG
jgi:hypothetical protein